jgi:putative membrane protein
MSDADDPRVFFAAERTLLAWVRTGLTVMGLGFVVARFGLFLRILQQDPKAYSHIGSTVIGVGLVLLGALGLAMAAWQHVLFCRGLAPHEKPHPYAATWSVWFASALALIGAVLAAYIVVRSNPI